MSRDPRAPVRLGLAGCGGIAYWAHLRSLKHLPGLQLVAAADPDPAARRRAADWTRAELLDRVEALWEREDVEAILIAAPTGLHASLALGALRAGKAVYLEKPLATDAAGGQAVVAMAEATGRPLAVGFNRRFHPVHLRARAWLAAGVLGRVRSIQSVFSEPHALATMPHWKRSRASGGGVLLDLGSHHFDLGRWLLGAEPVRVRATLHSEQTEHDAADVSVEWPEGVVMQSRFSFHTGPSDWLELEGEAGTLRVDRHRGWPELRLRRATGYGQRWAWERAMDLLGSCVRQTLRPGHDPSYRTALGAFGNWVAGAAGPGPGATVRDGAASLAMVLAAEAAVATGQWTPVTSWPAS